MKLNTKTIFFLAVTLAVIYMINSKLTNEAPGEGNGTWAVYGTKSCGWTRKQLEHMEKNKIPHKFIDCDKENCNEISAYPTMKSPSGETITGFKQVR
jgi:hypothetical protein